MLRQSALVMISAVLAGLLFGGPAHAASAPQVLALLAAPDGVPVRCADGTCTVELPTLCLEPERRTPASGQRYLAVDPRAITLTAHNDDGTVTAQSLPAEAEIAALRTHVAIRLSFPAPPNADAVALRIAGHTMLAPVRTGDSPDLARIGTERLPLVESILADDSQRRLAVRVSRGLINGLHDDTGMTAFDRHWRAHAAALPDGGGSELARFQRDFCRFSIETRLYETPADCLRAQQDGALEAIYDRYVGALAAGS